MDFTYYKVNSLDRAEIEEESFSMQSLIDQDGLEIKFFIGDFELRLETEKNAKNIDVSKESTTKENNKGIFIKEIIDNMKRNNLNN